MTWTANSSPVWATLEGYIRTWVVDALFVSGVGAVQVPVIFATEAGPRPSLPYVTLNVQGPRTVGQDDHRALDEDGVQDIVGDRLVTVGVQVFGPNAMTYARHLVNSLSTEAPRAKLAKNGIAVIGTAIVQNLRGLLEVGKEDRAQFDAVFAYAEEYEDNLGLIEHVEGEGIFATPAGVEHEIEFEAHVEE